MAVSSAFTRLNARKSTPRTKYEPPVMRGSGFDSLAGFSFPSEFGEPILPGQSPPDTAAPPAGMSPSQAVGLADPMGIPAAAGLLSSMVAPGVPGVPGLSMNPVGSILGLVGLAARGELANIANQAPPEAPVEDLSFQTMSPFGVNMSANTPFGVNAIGAMAEPGTTGFSSTGVGFGAPGQSPDISGPGPFGGINDVVSSTPGGPAGAGTSEGVSGPTGPGSSSEGVPGAADNSPSDGAPSDGGAPGEGGPGPDFHQGGIVPRSGFYNLQRGETVLPTQNLRPNLENLTIAQGPSGFDPSLLMWLLPWMKDKMGGMMRPDVQPTPKDPNTFKPDPSQPHLQPPEQPQNRRSPDGKGSNPAQSMQRLKRLIVEMG